MAESKKKCRQYSVEYLKYGFIPDPKNEQLPKCLICEKSYSNEAMKPSRMTEHLKKMHPEKAGKDLSFFKTLKELFDKRKTVKSMYARCEDQADDGLRASYNLSLLIAKTGKPHTIGEELILPSIREVKVQFCTAHRSRS